MIWGDSLKYISSYMHVFICTLYICKDKYLHMCAQTYVYLYLSAYACVCVNLLLVLCFWRILTVTDLFIFKKIWFIYFRERGREQERVGGEHRSVASRMPPTGDLTCNPDMCPDQESNQWPFGLGAVAQSTEPHQPELINNSLSAYIPSLKHKTPGAQRLNCLLTSWSPVVMHSSFWNNSFLQALIT